VHHLDRMRAQYPGVARELTGVDRSGEIDGEFPERLGVALSRVARADDERTRP